MYKRQVVQFAQESNGLHLEEFNLIRCLCKNSNRTSHSPVLLPMDCWFVILSRHSHTPALQLCPLTGVLTFWPLNPSTSICQCTFVTLLLEGICYTCVCHNHCGDVMFSFNWGFVFCVLFGSVGVFGFFTSDSFSCCWHCLFYFVSCNSKLAIWVLANGRGLFAILDHIKFCLLYTSRCV